MEGGGSFCNFSCLVIWWEGQVHLDFGLVVPKLSVRGMRCAVSDLMDLAPVNKVSLIVPYLSISFSAALYPLLFHLSRLLCKLVLYCQ